MIKAPSTDVAVQELSQSTAEVSEIVFFLLGAMTIVEIVDSHQGFKLVTDNISTRNPKTLLWVVSLSYLYICSLNFILCWIGLLLCNSQCATTTKAQTNKHK